MPSAPKRRVALIGTGHRGTGTWGKELLANPEVRAAYLGEAA